jgi:autotransporter strand-loop-strand O-heptosyltransferase
MNSFKVSYVTTLPKIGNAPRVKITGDIPHKYKVVFREYGKGIISGGFCNTNETIICGAKQWFTKWYVVIFNESNEIVFEDVFNPIDKKIFIKIDGYALGDNIAWMPYIEEFRIKNKCDVICSTFYNNLFINIYPDILFVKPNTSIENVYAQYYIGASNDSNKVYSPFNCNEVPLQFVASEILGLDFIEVRPDLGSQFKHLTKRFDDKYVTLSEFGSTKEKEWKFTNGWQTIVDFLTNNGYKVLVISKEPTNLKNVIDVTGDISLENRAVDILNAEFHLGISSGLSWLAWALGKHVFMISDVTPIWHEFSSDITRLGANDLDKVNYIVEGQTTVENVIEKLRYLIT